MAADISVNAVNNISSYFINIIKVLVAAYVVAECIVSYYCRYHVLCPDRKEPGVRQRSGGGGS